MYLKSLILFNNNYKLSVWQTFRIKKNEACQEKERKKESDKCRRRPILIHLHQSSLFSPPTIFSFSVFLKYMLILCPSRWIMEYTQVRVEQSHQNRISKWQDFRCQFEIPYPTTSKIVLKFVPNPNPKSDVFPNDVLESNSEFMMKSEKPNKPLQVCLLKYSVIKF